jgi:signal transduction histidine kinase
MLCQSQVELLTQGLKADWSAIYLTQRRDDNSPTKLFPLVKYPETDYLHHNQNLNLPPWLSFFLAQDANLPAIELDAPEFICDTLDSKVTNQIILPLIYEKIVMGLLVTGRNHPEWNRSELTQIEQIARTLAIACFLDRRQAWYQQQLEQKYDRENLQRELLDNLFHQLKNPLTALKTFGKLLLKRLLSDTGDEKVVRGILQQGNRIQDLLNQFEEEINLLTMDSLSPMPPALPHSPINPLLLPSATPNLEPVQLEDVLNPLIISATAIAQEKDIEVSCSLPAQLPAIMGNKQALREVLSNLIDNAIKYTPSGGEVEIIVSIKTSERGRQGAEIAISDTGYGIPPADRGRVFERHYRGVQGKGEIAGTGLGLAIVKDLIAQMQGTIELISPNPRYENSSYPGTIFSIWLPLANHGLGGF